MESLSAHLERISFFIESLTFGKNATKLLLHIEITIPLNTAFQLQVDALLMMMLYSLKKPTEANTYHQMWFNLKGIFTWQAGKQFIICLVIQSKLNGLLEMAGHTLLYSTTAAS